MKITIPELSLVVLVGPSGCGKSTFARKHFKATEVLSSDFCRGLVSDDENDQSATTDAFAVLHFIARKRLAAGRLTVIDATNVQPEARQPLVAIAREFHTIPVAIVLNIPEKLCLERNRTRPDRNFGPHVIRNQTQQLRRSIRGLEKEGFRHVHVFSSPEEAEAVEIERQPLWNNLRHEHGPFDIIGDVHGCIDELLTLLSNLGYKVENNGRGYAVTPSAGRKAVFVGDLVDRGPGITQVLRLVMQIVSAGTAFCVPGNHDIKLLRKLRGKEVKLTHGLADSLAQLENEPPEFKQEVAKFLDDLVSHYVFDDGKLVVAHAGMKEEMQGRGSGEVRSFALFGETTGETDEFGLPVRYNWAADYRGKAMVIYGHTPVAEPQWLNRTINIDTGCVFGGKLTALRYPEKELVSVPALKTYYESAKPFLKKAAESPLSAQHEHDELLEIDDVVGKRIVETALQGNITIREENAIAALEVMSRFAVNPKWLIYLPPTMSPCETSDAPGLLEHPAEAFAYYRNQGVEKVICEQKHMGSRAVVVLCRDRQTALKRFGIVQDEIGVCYTRTGRRFFNDAALESKFFACLHRALESAALWEELKSDWVCLDCELMPWSAKAQDLLRLQYAPTGSAARAALEQAVSALEQSSRNQADVLPLLQHYRERAEMAKDYVEAYRRYCWPVHALTDLKLAPFHLLASEGTLHADQDHLWHMQILARLCAQDSSLLLATPYKLVDLSGDSSEHEAAQWWEEQTSSGSEGMVVKPLSFIARNKQGIVQPAVKCRGREYLRIIYGPEYTSAENLKRLRMRGLGRKRSLALREFALGIEALRRFVQHEPLRRVHECVFGVLALESEPVDPRL
ncbi:MAG TPA: polynucleotide kinase-phosphatase [Terriglobales bacterium]|jgi:protein phosphatase|nr:polynucleotide kinase-phosphatase [Terriglobales bacterium]